MSNRIENVRVANVERREDSAAGNPRYRLHLFNGDTHVTEDNASVDVEGMTTAPVTLILNDKNRVIGIEK